jgi:hypothetical protein
MTCGAGLEVRRRGRRVGLAAGLDGLRPRWVFWPEGEERGRGGCEMSFGLGLNSRIWPKES